MLVVVLETGIVDQYGRTEANQTGTAGHGGALERGRAFHSRDSGSVSREGQAALFHRADHGLPVGGEEGVEAVEEDQQCPYFRGGRDSRGRTRQIDRRSVESFWRPGPAG